MRRRVVAPKGARQRHLIQSRSLPTLSTEQRLRAVVSAQADTQVDLLRQAAREISRKRKLTQCKRIIHPPPPDQWDGRRVVFLSASVPRLGAGSPENMRWLLTGGFLLRQAVMLIFEFARGVCYGWCQPPTIAAPQLVGPDSAAPVVARARPPAHTHLQGNPTCAQCVAVVRVRPILSDSSALTNST